MGGTFRPTTEWHCLVQSRHKTPYPQQPNSVAAGGAALRRSQQVGKTSLAPSTCGWPEVLHRDPALRRVTPWPLCVRDSCVVQRLLRDCDHSSISYALYVQAGFVTFLWSQAVSGSASRISKRDATLGCCTISYGEVHLREGWQSQALRVLALPLANVPLWASSPLPTPMYQGERAWISASTFFYFFPFKKFFNQYLLN
jgi:hypothetical protein